MNVSLTEYRQKRLEFEQLKKNIIKELQAEIHTVKPLDGVKSLDGDGLCFTIKLTTFQKEGKWSAEYYSPKVQVESVFDFLFHEPKNTTLSVEGVTNRIDTLLKQGYIKRKGDRLFLNTNMEKKLAEIRKYLI